VNVQDITGGSTWAIAAAAFSNPMYLSGPLGKSDNSNSTGFQITPGAALVVGFEGTYTGATVAHEQTMDPDGATGWFSVEGLPSTGGTATSTGSTASTAYVFTCIGVLHRIKVTALSSGTIEVRVRLESEAISAAGGGASGGGATAANQVLEIAALDEIVTELQTPASYLPLPGLAPVGDTTLLQVNKDISTATTTEVVAATVSQVTRVYRLVLVCTGANVLTFKSATGAIFPAITFGSSGGSVTLDLTGYWWFQTVAGEALNLTTTTTAAVGLAAYYAKGA